MVESVVFVFFEDCLVCGVVVVMWMEVGVK